jgi:hypothetical protein
MQRPNEQTEGLEAGPFQASRGRTSRGLARYIRRHLAAARRSGDPRRIASAEAEIAALRLAGRGSKFRAPIASVS